MAKKVVAPIWSEDGKTLTNALVNDKLKTYNVVTEWYDGTPMDSTKVDDDLVYISYEGKFLKENFVKEQDTFLEKNTVEEFRQLSTKELLLLKMGVYKGVRLNGYYAQGDTPAPIEYYLSDIAGSDDGGSVIEVGGVKLEHKFNGYIDVRYFGVKNDYNEDSVLNLTKAAIYAGNNTQGSRNAKLVIPSEINVSIYSDLSIPINVDLICHSVIRYKGSKDKTALTIGTTNERNYCNKSIIKISATDARSEWGNENYKGVVFLNTYSSQITIDYANFFTIGCEFKGDNGNGFVYNNVFLGEISYNYKAIVLNSNNSGWCNENKFFGGRIAQLSASSSNINTGKTRYGIIITSQDSYRQNNNVFYSPSIELNADAASEGGTLGEAIPISIEKGRHNKFINIRDEGNTITAETDNDSFCNDIDAGFSSVYASYLTRIRDKGLYPSTIFTTNIQKANQEKGWSILNIPNIASYLNQYNSTGSVFTKTPLKLQNSSSSSPNISGAGISIYEDYISINNQDIGLGFRINTNVRKRFNVAISALNKQYGAIWLVCRDSSGTIINGLDNVRISGRYQLVNTSLFGGGCRIYVGNMTNVDAGNVMQFFAVSDLVETVDVFISYYEKEALIKGIQVFSLDGQTDIIPYRKNYSLPLGTEMPSTFTYNGDFILSTSINQIGWKASGGAWREVGGLATPTVKGLVNQSAKVDDVASPNATDLDTAITLINELKAKFNAKLVADRTSGQQSTT